MKFTTLKATSFMLALFLFPAAAAATYGASPGGSGDGAGSSSGASSPSPAPAPAPAPSPAAAAPSGTGHGCVVVGSTCYRQKSVVVPGKGRTSDWRCSPTLNQYGLFGECRADR